MISPRRPRNLSLAGGFIESAVVIYATCVQVTHSLARLMGALWNHAWKAAGHRFAFSSAAPTAADVWWARAEFAATVASITVFAFWRIQTTEPEREFFSWLHNVAQGVACAFASLVLAIAWLVARADHSSRRAVLGEASGPIRTAVQYSIVLIPFLAIPTLGRFVWNGDTTMITSSAATVLLFLPVSYWFVYWVRASLLVSSHRFQTRGAGSLMSCATGVIVGALSLCIAVFAITAQGIENDGTVMLAAIGSVIMPATLAALSWFDYNRTSDGSQRHDERAPTGGPQA